MKLVDECAETVEEVKLAEITLSENENKYKCNYNVLFSILFTINVGKGAYFVIFTGTLKKILLVLSLILALKQRFIKYNFY